MKLTELVEQSATELQLAEALYQSDLNPAPSELLAVLKKTYPHPYENYAERWAIRHANEVLETVEYLREWREA